jgi:hypothetical protein
MIRVDDEFSRPFGHQRTLSMLALLKRYLAHHGQKMWKSYMCVKASVGDAFYIFYFLFLFQMPHPTVICQAANLQRFRLGKNFESVLNILKQLDKAA